MKPIMVIAAANGYMGQVLMQYFRKDYKIFALVRSQPSQQVLQKFINMPVMDWFVWNETAQNHFDSLQDIFFVRWDGKTLGDWAKVLDGADVLINLAGRSVNCRYNQTNKREILESRIESTGILGEAVARAKKPPAVWLNSSTATIYRHAEDREMDEITGEIGKGFSVEIAKAWETTFAAAKTPQTRKVDLRTAMVLGLDGGVLPVLAKLVRFGVGGTMGNGGQYVSWVHEHDVCRAIEFLIAQPLEGAVNIAAQPRQNKEFMALLRKALRQPIGIPSTDWMLEIGALVLQTETELILKSRRVVSTRLEQAGFRFSYPTFETALKDFFQGS